MRRTVRAKRKVVRNRRRDVRTWRLAMEWTDHYAPCWFRKRRDVQTRRPSAAE